MFVCLFVFCYMGLLLSSSSSSVWLVGYDYVVGEFALLVIGYFVQFVIDKVYCQLGDLSS